MVLEHVTQLIHHEARPPPCPLSSLVQCCHCCDMPPLATTQKKVAEMPESLSLVLGSQLMEAEN